MPQRFRRLNYVPSELRNLKKICPCSECGAAMHIIMESFSCFGWNDGPVWLCERCGFKEISCKSEFLRDDRTTPEEIE